MSRQNSVNYSIGERITLIVFAVSLTLYFFNIILGKASVAWGWDVFYLGNFSEFLLLLTASIFFVIAALYRETRTDNNNE